MSHRDRVKWNDKYAQADQVGDEPSRLLVGLAPLLPSAGRALDLAGGAGRHAVWLAQRGLDVTLVDISEVALAIAQRRAAARGRAIDAVCLDLDESPLPAGPWDLIVVFHFLSRPLFPALKAALAAGGLLVVVQPTRRNLERHARPSADYLLDEHELPTLVAGLQIERSEEGWLEEGRHEALVVARRLPANAQ